MSLSTRQVCYTLRNLREIISVFNNVLFSAVTEFFTLKSFEIVHVLVRSVVSHSNKITIAALCGKLHYRPPALILNGIVCMTCWHVST